MLRVKFPEQLPPEIQAWKTQAREITQSIIQATTREERHEIIDRYQRHWREPKLITWLSGLAHDKCWYTETKFGGDYQELEHFRPKKSVKNEDGTLNEDHEGYYWLAFDLDNYRLCKRRPNAKKGTFFPIVDERFRAEDHTFDCKDELPLFLDPLDEEDYRLLSFNDDGKPVPCLSALKEDTRRVKFTIDKYFLDEEVLNRRRKETWLATRKLFDKYITSMKKVKSAPRDRAKLRAESKKDLATLKKMLRPNEEFSAVARAALLKTGDPMAIDIVADAR